MVLSYQTSRRVGIVITLLDSPPTTWNWCESTSYSVPLTKIMCLEKNSCLGMIFEVLSSNLAEFGFFWNSAVVMSPKLQNINIRWKSEILFFCFWKSYFLAFYSKKTRFLAQEGRVFFVSGGNYPIQQSLCHPNLRTQTLDENLGSLFFFENRIFSRFIAEKRVLGAQG